MSNASSKKSFKEARQNFSKNLEAILSALNYSPTTFCMKLNALAGNSKSTIAYNTDVKDWLENVKIPSVYQLYKLSALLKISIDELFSSTLDISSIKGRSFAMQTSTLPSFLTVESTVSSSAINTKNTKGATTMANRNTNTITISKTQAATMRAFVYERTDSRKVNLLLAYHIYNHSKFNLKEIATRVGVSTRSLRDYAYDGTSISKEVATKLSRTLGLSFRQLGLSFDTDSERYVAMSIKTK